MQRESGANQNRVRNQAPKKKKKPQKKKSKKQGPFKKNRGLELSKKSQNNASRNQDWGETRKGGQFTNTVKAENDISRRFF